MSKKEEKTLTQGRVHKLGLDKVSVITADMLEGYTCIGEYAFQVCSYLTSIEIPDSVTNIGYGAFDGCYGLKSVEIHNGVTNIGDYAFSGCSKLTSITIPNSVTSIGDEAFFCCYGLTSVTIPDSVTSIGEGTFSHCNNLSSVTIPDSITSIGEWAFSHCNNLSSVTIGDKTYEKQTPVDGKCKAYKAFMANMTCRHFQYEEGKTYKYEGEPMLCCCGFHASLNLSDVFNYYCGEIGKEIVVHEVELEGVTDERNEYDSKVVAKKITIGKRII